MAEVPEQTGGGWSQVVSPMVDCLTMAAYFYFLPWLARSYLAPSWVNGVIIGFAFFMLLVAIYSLKELAYSKKQREEGLGVPVKVSRKRAPKKKKKNDDCCCSPMFYTMACSFVYCGFLAIVFIQAATKYDLNTDAGENAGAGLMFFAAMALLLVIVLPPFGETQPNSAAENLLHALSVLGIALVTIVSMAFWESMKLADPGGAPEQFHGIWKLIIFLLMVLVFAGFLGMPRIYLHIVKGDRWGLVTYMASLGYYVWDLFEF